MTTLKCPGQDTRFWTPSDIFDVVCKNCGYEIEFFKDDAFRNCDKCGHRIANPKLDLGCRQHCSQADACRELEGGNLTDEDD